MCLLMVTTWSQTADLSPRFWLHTWQLRMAWPNTTHYSFAFSLSLSNNTNKSSLTNHQRKGLWQPQVNMEILSGTSSHTPTALRWHMMLTFTSGSEPCPLFMHLKIPPVNHKVNYAAFISLTKDVICMYKTYAVNDTFGGGSWWNTSQLVA